MSRPPVILGGPVARGPQGPEGPQGEQGEQGLPGVNAVPAKDAVDAYNGELLDDPDSVSRITLDGLLEASVVDIEAPVHRAVTALIAGGVKVIPVTDYLLDGEVLPNDGILDAYPLIQRALDAIRLLGAADVFGVRYVLGLPAGHWRLDGTLNPCGPTTQAVRIGIAGAGSTQTVLLPYGNNSCIEPWMNFTTYPRNEYPRSMECTYVGMTFDMSNATHPDPTEASYKGFKGAGWVDCNFKDITILRSPATAFGNDYPVRCTFEDCHVITTGDGIHGAISNPTPISAAKSISGFGIGFGVLEDESVTFLKCSATDCHRGGFFFEMQHLHGTLRGAVIKMIGCDSVVNKIGMTDVATSGVHAINCSFTDNTYAGIFTGCTPFTPDYAGRDGTIQGCQILRNGTGIYSIGDIDANHAWTSLTPVLGGYRILDNRIEDNLGEGIIATWFKTLEDGGCTIRGNAIKNNGRAGIRFVSADDPLRDLVIDDNHFEGNGGPPIELLVAMNGPKITGNTFVGGDEAIVFHPAEPVTLPMIQANTFRGVTTPMVNVDRLDQTYVTGNRVLDGADDPDTADRLYRQTFYGGTDTAWPEGGDGWSQNVVGSPLWTRTSTGLRLTGTTAGDRSLAYRDFGASGLYVEASITGTTSSASFQQHTGVAIGIAAAGMTAVIAGVNGAATASGISSYFALWKIVAGTRTLLWESDVPLSERHAPGLARVPGSTLTHMFVDGELVHTLDIPDVPSTNLAGIYSSYLSGGVRRIHEFRAMEYAA